MTHRDQSRMGSAIVFVVCFGLLAAIMCVCVVVKALSFVGEGG